MKIRISDCFSIFVMYFVTYLIAASLGRYDKSWFDLKLANVKALYLFILGSFLACSIYTILNLSKVLSLYLLPSIKVGLDRPILV